MSEASANSKALRQVPPLGPGQWSHPFHPQRPEMSLKPRIFHIDFSNSSTFRVEMQAAYLYKAELPQEGCQYGQGAWESRTHVEKGKEFLLAGAQGDLWERRLEGRRQWGIMPGRWGRRRPAQGLPVETLPGKRLLFQQSRGPAQKQTRRRRGGSGGSRGVQGQLGCDRKDEERWMRFWLIHP